MEDSKEAANPPNVQTKPKVKPSVNKAKNLARGRTLFRLSSNEAALIIRKDGSVEIAGTAYGSIIPPLAVTLLRENEELAKAIQENYLIYIQEQKDKLKPVEKE